MTEQFPGEGQLAAEVAALDTAYWLIRNRRMAANDLLARLRAPIISEDSAPLRRDALRNYVATLVIAPSERAALEALERDGGSNGQRERVRAVCAALRRVAGVV